MKKNQELVLVDERYLENKIYIIRGQKVMLDKDLAEIYGYSTTAFNQQVKNNIEKFDKDFMFQLTKEEYDNLKYQKGTSKLANNESYLISKNLISSLPDKGENLTCKCYASRQDKVILKSQNVTSSWGGTRKLPYVFTEKGIYMLMTVLKGPLATKQSIALIRLFDSMKNYIVENRELISNRELELRTQLLEKDIQDIKQDNKTIKLDLKKVMDNFIDPSAYKHFLILDGQKLEADIAYKNIFKLAKHSIIYIDNYIGLKTLELLSYANNNVSITIISDNKAIPPLNQDTVNDFIIQNKTNKLTILKSNRNHDRYIILDFNTPKETIYHCGASLKDAGNKIATIQKIEDPIVYNKTIKEILKHNQLNLK